MNVAILGFGREGQSTLKFILKNRLYPKADITILEENKSTRVPAGFKKQIGKSYLKNISNFDIVFRSPGIPYTLPELQNARRAGVKFSSATKLFFEYLQTTNYKLQTRTIGLTGTKGKGTTATLLYNILTAYFKNASPEQRRRVFLVGNIGTPALDILPKLNRESFVIIELSSFQLQDLTVSPDIAVVLDIFPDHLDNHKTFREYLLAKSNIAAHQKPNDTIFYISTNRYAAAIARKSRGKKISVSVHDAGIPFTESDLAVPGAHNFQNAVGAYRIATFLGCPKNTARKKILSFTGLPHHLQFVREFRGVRYYNDSAAANPLATIAALTSFPGKKIILIAGGKNRNLNYAPLGKAVRTHAKASILIGENKYAIQKSIGKNQKIKVKMAPTLEAAVRSAGQLARTGDIILLSPGSASFDMFKNFEARGDTFTKFVRKLR